MKKRYKGGEREEDFLEHRTDGTDAFDTLYIGCETVCANESRVELAQTMPSAADIMQHRTDAFDTLYIGCETVCANEGRAELVPAMPSAAKLGALVHKFPFHDSFSLSVSGVS